MRTVFTFVGAFLLSMLVAGTIAVQIAISTDAHEEFIVAFFALELLGFITIAVFAIVYARASKVQNFTKAALIMFAAVFALSVALCVFSFSLHRSAAEVLNDAKIFVPAVLVAGLVILIQKWLIARRWRRMHPVASAAVV